MKVPGIIKAYCPKCKKHTAHKAKEYKAKKARGSMSWGQRKFLRKTKGYTSKVAGTTKKHSQSFAQMLILECPACKKKHPFSLGHSKAKVEVKKKE